MWRQKRRFGDVECRDATGVGEGRGRVVLVYSVYRYFQSIVGSCADLRDILRVSTDGSSRGMKTARVTIRA